MYRAGGSVCFALDLLNIRQFMQINTHCNASNRFAKRRNRIAKCVTHQALIYHVYIERYTTWQLTEFQQLKIKSSVQTPNTYIHTHAQARARTRKHTDTGRYTPVLVICLRAPSLKWWSERYVLNTLCAVLLCFGDAKTVSLRDLFIDPMSSRINRMLISWLLI